MSTRRIVTTLAVLALLAAPSFAERYYYPDGDSPIFSVEILNSWSVEAGEGVLHASPPDGSVYLGFVALDATAMDTAVEALEEAVTEMVADFEVAEEGDGDLNGMPAYFVDGQGLDEEGGPLNASVVLFTPDGQTFCFVIYFGSPEAESRHESSLGRILNSIQPE